MPDDHPSSTSDLFTQLRRHIQGDVTSSKEDLKTFSTDASIFTIRPAVIVKPRNADDVAATVELAKDHGVPITSRGGGTSTAGQAIGGGIIIDFQAHMNRVLDTAEDFVWAEPGVILNDLNNELARTGRKIGPDPSSHKWCTVGGMIANNASGPRSYTYGSMRDHLELCDLVLADGSRTTSWDLAQKFGGIVNRIARAGCVRRPSRIVRKNSSGYDLSGFRLDPPNLTPLLCGSEGTLAIVTRARLKTVPRPMETKTAVYAYDSFEDAIEDLEQLKALQPVALEMVDHYILEAMNRVDPLLAADFGLERAQVSIWAEWEGPPFPNLARGTGKILEDPAAQARLWNLRSEASSALHQQPGDRRPLRVIEDACVPPHQLATYLSAVREILRKNDCDGAIFGHVGDAHIHINPNIDVTQPDLWNRVECLMEDTHQLVWSLGGTISGEHGDGILRRSYLAQQWPEEFPIFRMIKQTFDPEGVLNPDKKITIDQAETFQTPNLSEASQKPIPCLNR